MSEEFCICGRPLHYTNSILRRQVDEVIKKYGPLATVVVGGKKYLVPRHYISLHGIRGEDISKYGFEEVK